MKKLVSTFTLILVVILSYGNTFAQQWSSEQKDVWAGVENIGKFPQAGDAQGFMSYFDDSYMGWNYRSKVPQSKANTSKWVENGLKNNSTVLYTLSPLTIWVKGDFAYVHYYYAELDKKY